MATTLSDETIRCRTVRAKLEWAELKRLIGMAAVESCGLKGAADGVNNCEVDVTISQEQEGSPSYSVQKWSAIVTVKLDVD